MIKRIWLPRYRPFVMGGSPDSTLASDIDCEGPVEIGKGLTAYTATAPNGMVFVADSVSLGIVGNSLESVRKDVEEGDLEVMQQQQTQALASYKRDESRGNVEVVAPGYFWAQLNALV